MGDKSFLHETLEGIYIFGLENDPPACTYIL